jgi:hypothetical protein
MSVQTGAFLRQPDHLELALPVFAACPALSFWQGTEKAIPSPDLPGNLFVLKGMRYGQMAQILLSILWSVSFGPGRREREYVRFKA